MARIYQMPHPHGEEGISCLTFDRIMDYVEDKLSPQEKLQADQHLEECNLCRDAIAAAESYPNQEELRPYVESVGRKFRSALEAQQGVKRVDWGLYYRLAAVLVIGVAAVLYLSRDKPHEKLFAEYFEPHPNIISVDRSKKEDGDLEQAALHYQVKEYTQALKFFKDYLESNPDSVKARFYAGVSYLATDDVQNAIVSFQKVIAAGKNDLQKPAEWYLGLAYLKGNDLENARAVFNKIISYDGAYKDEAMELLKRLNSFE